MPYKDPAKKAEWQRRRRLEQPQEMTEDARERVRLRRKEVRESNLATYGTRYTENELQKMYHCSLEQYAERMGTSDSCEVCGSEKNLCYDHCHETMVFRGVLCRCCNQALGKLGDNLEGLKRAVEYLEKN